VSIFSQGLCISPSHVLEENFTTRITVWEIYKGNASSVVGTRRDRQATTGDSPLVRTSLFGDLRQSTAICWQRTRISASHRAHRNSPMSATQSQSEQLNHLPRASSDCAGQPTDRDRVEPRLHVRDQLHGPTALLPVSPPLTLALGRDRSAFKCLTDRLTADRPRDYSAKRASASSAESMSAAVWSALI
jgi:hypothetical protein